MLNFKVSWTIDLWILAFYVFSALLVFAAASVFEPIREEVQGIDHVMRRIINIIVVGLSDFIFKGSSRAAYFIYMGLVLLMFFLGYEITSLIFRSDLGRVIVVLINGGNIANSPEFLKLFLAGLALIYTGVFISLPILAITLPTWRNMTIRPVLKIQPEKRFARSLATQSSITVAHISDLHVQDSVPNMFDGNVIALSQTGNVDADIIALTGDLTDKGSALSWQNFLALPQISCRDERLVIVPGNHDLNTWHNSPWASLFSVEPQSKTEANRKAFFLFTSS